ncbi:MAG: N-acetylmuramoyl-L-alanine amidase [Epsilonproteobacteria bacterium]|nr:N-acetylmuramoyl-L-alanine amidase [Campylobacterota bacterium]
MQRVLLLLIVMNLYALEIIKRPIEFDASRIEMTKEYIKSHYAMTPYNIKITPKIIMIHHTGMNDTEESYSRFHRPLLTKDRSDINKGGMLNVSAHYLVGRDGKVYEMMSPDMMARHVIGLNYFAIGIENVGARNLEDNLTQAQLQANIELVEYLKNRYDSIEYLAGHYEYRCFEDTPMWLERDHDYRTVKHDPPERFMNELRSRFTSLKRAPCDK